MSFFAIERPGTKLGPCKDELCPHDDCQRARGTASVECPLCGEALGYGRNLTKTASGRLAHFACVEEAIA